MAYPLPSPSPASDLAALLDDWLIELRGHRKSANTLEGYRASIRAYIRFCAEHGYDVELTKPRVIEYLATTQCQASTARLHLTVLKLFAKWLAENEGFDADPILAVKGPKQDQKAVPNLCEDEVRRMIKVCAGASLRDRRDKAILMLFAETGLRSAELLACNVDDVDVVGCLLVVRRGKGGKGRRVKFSVTCAAALNAYRRARRAAGFADDDGPLFISEKRGGRLVYTGLVHTLKDRAKAAGVAGFHIHRLRHTMAVSWLKAGGSETGLMAQAGWSSRTMIDRYVKTASEQLAAEEFDRLDLGYRDS